MVKQIKHPSKIIYILKALYISKMTCRRNETLLVRSYLLSRF